MFVECMTRYCVGFGRIGGPFVFIGVFDTIWGRRLISPWCADQIHYNDDGGCVFMWFECMERGTASCWPWTNSTYVRIDVCLNLELLFVFDAVWGRNLTLMCCQNTLQYWSCRLCSLNTCHVEQEVRSYWCVLGFEGVIYYDRCNIYMRSQSHPEMFCPNTLQMHYNGMTALRLCSLHVWNGIVVFVLDEQIVHLYWCVFEFEVIHVRCSMRS